MKNIKRLVLEFIPKAYNLNLDISKRQQRTFSGKATIEGSLVQTQSTITLHAKELHITNAQVDNKTVAFTSNADADELILSGQTFEAGQHLIKIDFDSAITDPMNGLYPSYFKLNGVDEELLATQFESHHAREVFPCIDEPEAKATFALTLTTEPGITVVSNTPVKQQQKNTDTLVTLFETTPVMSTYLLAWVAGKLDYLEATTKGGVTVRAYATPDKVKKTQFALDTAVKTLDFYNEYFDIAYPLPKYDMVGLPDFSSGAMENWGCVTYRESCYLVDEHSAIGVKQYVANVVAHELAHQWFGNLVTMKWWDDLWLNESFASWIEYLALDHIFPQWQVWTQFYDSETSHALDRDSLANVQKVRQEVNDPEEIRTLFDGAIVYGKGASLLQMLHAHIGAEAFRDGLRVYLKKHQYANAVADDLWQALSKVSGKDIAAFMQPWISQPGHPVVKATIADTEVTIEQQRFFSNPKEPASTTLWPVPLLSDALDENLLTTAKNTFSLAKTTPPLLLNQGRTGFYVTAYAQEHLDKLAAEVRAGALPIVDRLGLLSEAYDLARAGQQSTLHMLKLLTAYQHEKSEPVWAAIVSAIQALRMLINEDKDLKPLLQTFVAAIAREQFERLGWERITGEPYFDELLRPTVVGLMSYSEEPEVIDKALALFSAAQEPQEILGDIRSTIFAASAKFGGEKAFAKLLSWYRKEQSAELRIQICAGLCSTKDDSAIKQLLQLITTKEVKLQDVFYWFIYLIRNPFGRDATWQWMKDNWQWIEKNFGSDMHFADFPTYSASGFSTAEQLASYKKFFEQYANNPALQRPIRQGMEAIESRVLWRERDFNDVANYLQKR